MEGDRAICRLPEDFQSRAMDEQGCRSGHRPFSNRYGLALFFRDLDRRPPYELANPKWLCAERAVMLVDQLRRGGYASRLVVFKAPEGSYLTPLYRGSASSFGQHYAVEVTTMDGSGPFILDPQFSDRPETLPDYLELLGRPRNGLVELHGYFGPPVEREKVLEADETGIRRLNPYTPVMVGFSQVAPGSEFYAGVLDCQTAHARNLAESMRLLRGER